MNEFQSLLGELVERVKPDVCVETGFMTGESAKAVLAALHKNNKGKLWSIEPFYKPGFEDPRLNFVWGYSTEKMEVVYKESSPWDVFLHDSNHDVGCMTYELELAWWYTRPGGIIVCDDHTWGTPPHRAWDKFCERHGLKNHQHKLGSCQYIVKSISEPMPLNAPYWPNAMWRNAALLSNQASAEYGAKPIFTL